MNNKKDFNYIKSKKYQEKVAKAVPIGLQNYLTRQVTVGQ
jgi:N-acetylmuramoyl-L-alanine amidase